VQAALDAVPELNAVLLPTAIGKDYPYDGAWYGLTPSRTGLFFTWGGYLGLKLGWVEGLELNSLGGVAGIDLRRPAVKLPAPCNCRKLSTAPTMRVTHGQNRSSANAEPFFVTQV
jgi:hypothetical protein